MLKQTWAAGVVLVCLVCCSVGESEQEQDWTASNWEEWTPNDLQVRSAVLSGDLGRERALQRAATQVESIHYDGFSRVTLSVETARGLVMVILDVDGGLDREDLGPGTRRSYAALARRRDPEPRGDLALLGCEGRAEGAWDYDEYASDIELQVEATGGSSRHMTLDATWRDDGMAPARHALRVEFEFTVP